MRKKDRETTDASEIEAVLRRARILRLAINDPGAPPYIVPVNFGYCDGAIYFHGSHQGRKMELIAKDPMVAFEAEADVTVVSPTDPTNACEWSTAYRSVIGRGKARLLTDPDEKRDGLRVLMSSVAPEVSPSAFTIPDDIVKITAVVKIEIERMTGKKYRV